MAPAYINLMDDLVGWANAQEDIRAMFVVGSRGKQKHPPAGADLDIIIITTRSQRYRNGNLSWCNDIGPSELKLCHKGHHIAFPESHDFTVVFKPDLDVDFSFVLLTHLLKQLQLARLIALFPKLNKWSWAQQIRASASAFQPEFLTLLDRDSLESKIRAVLKPLGWIGQIPGEDEFFIAIDEFLLYVFKAIKKVQSGKLYAAKWACDVNLKLEIARFAEWHMRSQSIDSHSIRFRDLSLDEWADDRVKVELADTFASYELHSVCLALTATLNLFYWMVAEIARNLDYQDRLVQVIDRIEWLRTYVEMSCKEAS